MSDGTALVVILVIALLFGGSALMGYVSTQRYKRRFAARVKRVRTASAEAEQDDTHFAHEAVEAEAAQLFRAVQNAWDARDDAALARLAGPDLLVEWRRRLQDFEDKGWHSRAVMQAPPQVHYVGMVNREDDLEDRAVVLMEAVMDLWCTTRTGEDIFLNGATSARTVLREYWTLARSSVQEDARWLLESIEQLEEGDHQLDSEIVATPWADDARVGAAATLEVAAADLPTPGYTTADLVDPDFAQDARAAALDLSLVDARFGPDVILACVGRAVEAWVQAVDGPDAALAALATPEAIRALLHPGDGAADPRTRLVVRGVRVTKIDVQALEPSPEPARITVAITARGRRYVEDRDTVALISGDKDRAREFVESWTLALTGDEAAPWRIVGGGGAQA